jgi:lysyl-tRNA synthetase class 1
MVSYGCECGHKETADISKENIGKLEWKVDWPMRWKFEGVCFEPGGADHASPGGSFTVASRIAKGVYGIEPPKFEGYAFVGVEGASKMSGSKGTGIIPKDLLQIYEPELIRWTFARFGPTKPLTLYFGSQVINQYEEFDRTIEQFKKGTLNPQMRRAVEFSKVSKKSFESERVPFRQVASFGQVAQGNLHALKDMFDRIGCTYEERALKERLERSQVWVEKYNPQLRVRLRDEPNHAYYKALNDEEKSKIEKLRTEMSEHWTLEGLTALVYGIPKVPGMTEEDKKIAQRNFFKTVYQMMVDSDTGPRLPSFLLALGKKKVEKLLSAR